MSVASGIEGNIIGSSSLKIKYEKPELLIIEKHERRDLTSRYLDLRQFLFLPRGYTRTEHRYQQRVLEIHG